MIIEEKDIVHTTGGGKSKLPRLIRRDPNVEFVEFNSRGADEMVTGRGDLGWAKGGSGRRGTGLRKYCERF